MNRRVRSTVTLVVLAMVMATAACSSSVGSAGGGAKFTASSLSQVVQQAKQEGQLNLVWGEGVLGGTKGLPKLAEGFRKHFGLPADFKVSFTPGPSQAQMAASLDQEVQAGQNSTSDIMIAYPAVFRMLLGAGVTVFKPEDWSWATDIPKPAVQGGGVAVAVVTSIPVITYNSKKVTDPPKSMQDLLAPRWKGRVASTPYASNFPNFAATIGQDQALSYITAFSKQLGGLIPCTEDNRVLSGEFDALAFDCDQSTTLENMRAGGALRYVIPSDAAMLTQYMLGTPVNSAHPAAAQLFIDYLMTREAQDTLWNVAAGDSVFVKGSNIEKLVAASQADGVTFHDWDLDAVLADKDWPSSEYLQNQVSILTKTK
ncbi:ABC transporter substrate-binding protein [Catenulispora pinisilvae]|uniref:ABC transporter substrate-binding protein n=1 Tax=Catenulispora pinisilvae TaxID=2705253 RepID=UPI0018912A4A|nr:extracellular solute-binding protein [Catenulispora pinisilvae]